jgi:hypothetical protein
VGLVEQLVRDDLDLARVELRAQRGQLILLELVLGGECLQGGIVDRAALLGVLEEGLDRGRKSRCAQVRSLLRSGRGAQRGRRCRRTTHKTFRRDRIFPFETRPKGRYGPRPCA